MVMKGFERWIMAAGDVWVEYVPPAHFTDFYVLPNINAGSARVFTNGSQEALGKNFTIAIFHGDDLVTTEVSFHTTHTPIPPSMHMTRHARPGLRFRSFQPAMRPPCKLR